MILKEKVILLTGGADGIGWECAKAYARAGAAVCVADINERGEKKIEQLGGEGHLFVECDITREDDVEILFNKIGAKYARLDAIHNNAGIACPSKPLHDTNDKEWENVFNVNLKSILLTTKYGINYIKAAQGTILNTSSLVGTIGQVNHAAYAATKGAVNALTKSMALDYAEFGIRVNAVSPAAVKTPMLEVWTLEQSDTVGVQQFLDRLQPLGKMPGGDVIADVCLFLMSEAARFITGCILPVSGGAELGYRSHF